MYKYINEFLQKTGEFTGNFPDFGEFFTWLLKLLEDEITEFY